MPPDTRIHAPHGAAMRATETLAQEECRPGGAGEVVMAEVAARSQLSISRLCGSLPPLGVALLLSWSYADSFIHPTFFGDQGVRLDRAADLVVGVGRRVWLPFLQLHVHLLYLARAPAATYLVVPYAYTVLSLFLVAALCRAALRNQREALLATTILLLGFAGSSFHWLGRSLYQEVIVLPLFLMLVYLHYFAPQRRVLFLVVFAVGMLTREVFWVWWAVFLALHWRQRLRDSGFRWVAFALGALPLLWLAATAQSPLLARNVVAENGSVSDSLGEQAAILGGLLVSGSFLPVLVCLAVVFATVVATRGLRGLSFRSYHIFSLLSLGGIYTYVLFFDPWQSTPGNTRVLVPLYAHVLFWAVLAWRDAARLAGGYRAAARAITALGILSLLKFQAIAGVLGGATPRTSASWEPLHLATSLSSRDDWRATLNRALQKQRAGRGASLRVAFVGVPRPEYLKFWVAAFLYDERRAINPGDPTPAADLVVAPAGFQAPGWVLRIRLRLPEGIVRDVLEPELGAPGKSPGVLRRPTRVEQDVCSGNCTFRYQGHTGERYPLLSSQASGGSRRDSRAQRTGAVGGQVERLRRHRGADPPHRVRHRAGPSPVTARFGIAGDAHGLDPVRDINIGSGP